MREPFPNSRFGFQSGWPAILGSLLLLAVAMAAVRLPFRNELREQLAIRDARILASLIQQQLDDPENPAAGDDPLAAIIAASIVPDFPGVEAVQAYSPEGRLFATFLGETNALSFPTDHSRSTSTDEPIVTFHTVPKPRLDVWIPLRPSTATEIVGFTFIALDGQDLASEYARLDASLLRQVWFAFLLIGSTLVVILFVTFRSLHRANQLLAERSARLEAANRELSLTARTSAVGAVASHLVHGLRNPLASLLQAVAEGGDSRDAADSARRMRTMIDEVVRVLRDEEGLSGFEVPASEVLSEAIRRARRTPNLRPGIRWESTIACDGPIGNRDANLTLMVLENLAVNAAQAFTEPGTIRFTCERTATQWTFTVADDGPGIPTFLQPRIFQPSFSTKASGSGLGLALSRQLARHMGGELSLDHSEPGSTLFSLRVPIASAHPAQSVQSAPGPSN